MEVTEIHQKPQPPTTHTSTDRPSTDTQLPSTPSIELTVEPSPSPNIELPAEPSSSLNIELPAEPSPSPNIQPPVEPSPSPNIQPPAEPSPSPNIEPPAEPSPLPNIECPAEPSPSPNIEPSPSLNIEPPAEPSPSPNIEPPAEPSPSPNELPSSNNPTNKPIHPIEQSPQPTEPSPSPSTYLHFNIEKRWSVEVPWYKTHIEGKDQFTLFTLRVYYGEHKWTVEKRFSDIFKFSEELSRKYEGVPSFPARTPKIFHDPKFLQNRALELSGYFSKFDQAAFMSEEMRNFLQAYSNCRRLGIDNVNPEIRRLEEVYPDTLYATSSSVLMPNGLPLPVRMTVIKLKSTQTASNKRDLLLYSPTLLEDALKMELEALGHVKYIVAPNKLHTQFFRDYLYQFPDATLFVAPSMRDWDSAITPQEANPSVFGDEIAFHLTKGNSFFSEIVLFHKETSALIVADFIVNFPVGYFSNQPNGEELSNLAAQFYSETPNRPMCSPEHLIYCNETNQFKSTCQHMLSWNFSSIIMSHGAIVKDPTQALETFKIATDQVIRVSSERWSLTNTVFSFFGKK